MPMNRTQLNIALAVVAAGLGAAVFFSQKKPPPKGPPLTALKASAITHIAIAHPGKPDIDLDKQNGTWRLTAPVQAAADPIELDQVLELATTEAKSTLPDAGVRKSDLGLDPPNYTVRFNDVTLGFGALEPLKYLRYVDTGSRIALIDDPNSMPLDADYSDLVSKALVPPDSEIVRIDLPGGTTVARSADGKAWSVTPQPAQLQPGAAKTLVDAWQREHSMWNQLATAPDTQGDAVTITLKDGRALTYRVVGRDPQFVLERDDLKVRYTVAKDDAGKLLQLAPAAAAAAAAKSGPAAPAAGAPPQKP
jgi:hypothetical protein